MRRRAFQQRLTGAIESMIPGTVGGRVAGASPVRHTPTSLGGSPPSPVQFSLPGSVTASLSGPWMPDEDMTLVSVRALLGTAGTSSTVVTVYVNGSSVGTVTLASGATSAQADIYVELVRNTDVVTLGVTTAGAGAAMLTVIVRFS